MGDKTYLLYFVQMIRNNVCDVKNLLDEDVFKGVMIILANVVCRASGKRR